jgi:hypothetical protein
MPVAPEPWRAALAALALLATASLPAFSARPPAARSASDRQAALRQAGGSEAAANLRSLAQRAGTIVAARVVQVRPGTHPAYPRVGVTFVTLRVTEAFKGAAPGDFTFMQIGHAGDTPPPAGAANFLLLPDLPSYRPGEEILLFLYPPSDAGLTSPVDGLRGKFPLARDPATGQLQVVGMVLSPGTGPTPYAPVRVRLRQLTASQAPAKQAAPQGARRER